MTRGEDFIKKGGCQYKDCSAMSTSAWTDLNSQGNILKLHDKCPNPKCNCQKNHYFYTSSIYAWGVIDKK